MTKAPWIKWNGGKCPVPPKTKVETHYANIDVTLTCAANIVDWNDDSLRAYRVIKPAQGPEPNFTTRITEAEEMAKDAYATLKDACTDFAGDSYEQGEFEESTTFYEVGERLNRALGAFMAAAALARDYARREV